MPFRRTAAATRHTHHTKHDRGRSTAGLIVCAITIRGELSSKFVELLNQLTFVLVMSRQRFVLVGNANQIHSFGLVWVRCSRTNITSVCEQFIAMHAYNYVALKMSKPESCQVEGSAHRKVARLFRRLKTSYNIVDQCGHCVRLSTKVALNVKCLLSLIINCSYSVQAAMQMPYGGGGRSHSSFVRTMYDSICRL